MNLTELHTQKITTAWVHLESSTEPSGLLCALVWVKNVVLL